MLRIVYMGTPQFAVPALQALIANAQPGKVLPEGYELATVVTRPDKPAGRGNKVVFSPVKQAALEANIPVWQPGSFKKTENSTTLAHYEANLYIVAAFGQILPKTVLEQPHYGTLNIHASLLPKYRGADPIAEAILQGDAETGISIMLIDEGIDTGPVLTRKTIAIAEDETTGTLTPKLADLGAQTLLEMLPGWLAGAMTPEQQDAAHASHTRMLRKEDGRIKWSLPAAVIARQVRAYSPWPASHTHWRGKYMKILKADNYVTELDSSILPGTVTLREIAGRQVLAVTTGSGLLIVKQLQLEGKKAMESDEFLRGYAHISGEALE